MKTIDVIAYYNPDKIVLEQIPFTTLQEIITKVQAFKLYHTKQGARVSLGLR